MPDDRKKKTIKEKLRSVVRAMTEERGGLPPADPGGGYTGTPAGGGNPVQDADDL